MPPAVPLIAAAAGAYASTAVGVGALAFASGLGLSVGGTLLVSTAISSGFGLIVSTGINQLGSRLLSKKPKTPDFSQQGQSFNVRSSIDTHKIVYGQTRVWGTEILTTTTNNGRSAVGAQSANKMLHLAVVLASHEVEEIGAIYFNDQLVALNGDGFVTTAPYTLNGTQHYAYVAKHLGASDQIADQWMVGDIPGWTDNHRLRGRAYLYVRFEYSQNAFPLGVPQISAVVKGKKVYDPRTGLTAWSDNVALCIRDYVLTECNVATTRFDDDYTSAAANICDEDVTLQDASTQNRYTCNGILDTGTSRQENLNALTASLAGSVLRVGNKVRIFAGAYDVPVGTIDDDMLAGDISIRASTPRTELVNTVRGTYTDPNKGYQSTDFPVVSSATFIEEDNDQEYSKDLQLPFTNHPEAAQRIAKLIMNKARQGITVELPLQHDALKFACWDVIELDEEYVGFSAKPFRIVRWNMPSVPNSTIQVSLQEESSESYDWTSDEATVHDDSPDTTLPSPWIVGSPGVPQVTEQLYTTTDGSGVKAKGIVSWGASEDPFVREYQLEFKLTTATDYSIAGRTFGLIVEIPDISPGLYLFRVKAISRLGVDSPYTDTVTTEFFGLTAPPADITNFSLNTISDNAHITWDQATDLDVRVGGRIRIRYTPDTASPTWSGAIDIGPALPGIATNAVLPLLNGSYLIKAVDSVGNESVNAASILTNIVKMNRVAISTQHPTFPGSATDMEVVDGALRLSGAGLFDDGSGNFDDASGLFDLGGGAGYSLSGSYQFGTYIDVGKITTSRVTAAITADVFSEDTLLDDAPGDFDDRNGLFDGGDSSHISVRLEVRTANDDPSGTPTWSDWRQFFVGDYTCRAYQFRVLVTNTDSSTNVNISALAVTVDMPDVIDSGTLTTSAAGVTHITFSRTFVVTPDIGITIQNAQTGDYESVSSVSATGFDFGVKNAGVFVARTTSWLASAY